MALSQTIFPFMAKWSGNETPFIYYAESLIVMNPILGFYRPQRKRGPQE